MRLMKFSVELNSSEFRLSYYPHKFTVFTEMLREIFGSKAAKEVYGDFKQLSEAPEPAFYLHVLHKTK